VANVTCLNIRLSRTPIARLWVFRVPGFPAGRSGYLKGMRIIRVGLMADPASPTDIAAPMSDISPPEGEDRDTWDVEVVSEPFTTGSENVDIALERLADHARQHKWDVVVGLTELPLRDENGRYLLVHSDTQRQSAVLSVPALGGFQMQTRARQAGAMIRTCGWLSAG